MPTVEGLQFAYALHHLPPGRFPFSRWRWELWHGAALVAAGWRTDRRAAQRALQVHAANFGRRLFGLRGPAKPFPTSEFPLGASVRVDAEIACTLVPRALEQPALV